MRVSWEQAALPGPGPAGRGGVGGGRELRFHRDLAPTTHRTRPQCGGYHRVTSATVIFLNNIEAKLSLSKAFVEL